MADTVPYGQQVNSAPSPEQVTQRRSYWHDEISKAEKRYGVFHRAGTRVVDRYRLERDSEAETELYQDRYNILYSSTETTKPSLYVQSPKVEATARHKDRKNETVSYAVQLLEAVGQYALEENDFDGVMKNVVQDYLLPGMGQVWVRYEPTISTQKDESGADVEKVTSEAVEVDYVHYKDFITGVGRVWKELPWVARRVYFDKVKATKRFGSDIANKLAYSYRPTDDGNGNRDFAGSGGAQAVIWEIWDKINRKAVWFSVDYAEDVLDERDDPLRLKGFFPCPEPIRAVWTTRTFIPKSFYSQYRAQAEELDNLTQRIRYLTKALRLVGVYDGSQEKLKDILTGNDNKLVAINSWAAFAQQGGMSGSIQWLPIKEVAEVLMNLLQQRETVKNEIYEITGFSDIVRGVSKASETLGAQKIKADWAGGRLRDMQKEVQRFCRDVIRIMSEVMSELFSEESLAMYSGFEPPEVTPEEQQAAAQYAAAMAQYAAMQGAPQPVPGMPGQQALPQPPQKPPPTRQQQAIQMFSKVVALLKSEKQRCAQIGIETDSTIMPDEAAERKDRMDFLGAAGAFLQQAGPMVQQYPEMRGLLGSLLMFAVRTFRASRPIEKDFEAFAQQVQNSPPPPQEGEGQGKTDPAELQMQMQIEQNKLAAQAQSDATAAAAKKYETDTKAALEREQAQRDHEYRMAELDIKRRELALKEREVSVKEAAQKVDEVQATIDKALAADNQQHSQELDRAKDAREDRSEAREGAGGDDD